MNDDIKIKLDTYSTSETELPKIIIIYGPTACGKTALSIDIARYLNTEIISADSRQVYRYMDIGTGKVTPEEMNGVVHHMIDVIDPSVKFSMVDFTTMALPIVDSISRKWKIPILCGGTWLYIDGVLYDMEYPDTPPDWEYRNELENIRLTEGNQVLWNMLYAVDPAYAVELSVGNYRYVMRGLEVLRATGRSKRESKWKKTLRFSPLFVTPYTDSERAELYLRINKRVQGMYENWLLEEVRYIIDNFNSHCPGLETIGYKEVVDYIEWRITLSESISLVQQHSRNYAKRQVTWNKKYEIIARW